MPPTSCRDTGLLCPHSWPKILSCRRGENTEQQPPECPQNCAGVTANTHEMQKDGKLTVCTFCIIREESTVALRFKALLLSWWLFWPEKEEVRSSCPAAHESCAVSS